MGVRDSRERPKMDASNVQDTAKAIKGWGMPCFTQVESSSFPFEPIILTV